MSNHPPISELALARREYREASERLYSLRRMKAGELNVHRATCWLLQALDRLHEAQFQAAYHLAEACLGAEVNIVRADRLALIRQEAAAWGAWVEYRTNAKRGRCPKRLRPTARMLAMVNHPGWSVTQ